MAWFETAYRRHLADMHIEDWNEKFLSEFSPEDYYQNLKTAYIQAPMIYLQSHVGYCYWNTKTGKTHSAFKNGNYKIKELIDFCHEGGMSVVGYYSVIYNTWAEDKHPEWSVKGKDGLSPRKRNGSRYGLCCPNSADYRSFVTAQIKEISEEYSLEGMFYDMLFWPEICYCPSCKARWEREVGGEMPKEVDWNDERWLTFAKKRIEWMGEFAAFVTGESKKYMPNTTVEHNCACSVAGDWSNAATELVNDSCDYTGGDLYGDLYNHSFTAKYYKNISRGKPFEYMTCRCDNNLQKHTITKTERHLALEVLLTSAHHGANFVIDAVDPVGTLDSRVYDRLGKVFKRQMQYEPWFKGEMIENVGVFYCASGRYNPNGDSYDSKSASVNSVKTLIEKHIPVGVVSNGAYKNLNKYRCLLAPAVAGLFEGAKKAIIDYVREGGVLYFSGNGEPELIKELLDGEIIGISKSNRTYIAPRHEYEEMIGEFNTKYPLPADYRQAYLKLPADCGVIADITLPYTNPCEAQFASIHSNPPGISTEYPSVVVRKYGKGSVMWSAVPIENETIPHYKEALIKLIGYLCGGVENLGDITCDAPSNIEIITYRTENGFIVNAVDLLSAEETIFKGDFTVSIKHDCAMKVKEVPNEEIIPSKYKNGFVSFMVKNLEQYAVFELTE